MFCEGMVGTPRRVGREGMSAVSAVRNHKDLHRREFFESISFRRLQYKGNVSLLTFSFSRKVESTEGGGLALPSERIKCSVTYVHSPD